MNEKVIDETGNRYGKLTVVEYLGKKRWLCQCDCGNTRIYRGAELRNGARRSCGCTRSSMKVDMRGQKYGKLTPMEYLGKSFWLCQCDCGKTSKVKQGDLKSGHIKSCGCNILKHDFHDDKRFKRLYRIWIGMRRRCNSPKCVDYKSYGAKGIKVCEEWDDFNNFYFWSINNGYEDVQGNYRDKMSIDRIDSSKGYSPDNCQWISISENSARVSEHTHTLEQLIEKTDDEMVKEFLERKMQYNLQLQKEKKQIREDFFPCRKNNYCIIRSIDNEKQFIFKSFRIAGLFLNISVHAISYRVKFKNGVLTDDWRIEKITKDEFDELKRKGVEVIK